MHTTWNVSVTYTTRSCHFRVVHFRLMSLLFLSLFYNFANILSVNIFCFPVKLEWCTLIMRWRLNYNIFFFFVKYFGYVVPDAAFIFLIHCNLTDYSACTICPEYWIFLFRAAEKFYGPNICYFKLAEIFNFIFVDIEKKPITNPYSIWFCLFSLVWKIYVRKNRAYWTSRDLPFANGVLAREIQKRQDRKKRGQQQFTVQ